MELLEGKKISEEILGEVKKKIENENLNPGLAVILVGNDEASKIYVGLKEKAAEKVGIDFYLHKFNNNASEEEILEKITQLNEDENINGILVQLPLPEYLDKQKIIETIDLKKDVDGFSSKNNIIEPVLPMAIMKLIQSAEGNMHGKKGIIICNSEIFGSIMEASMKKAEIEPEYILKNNIQENLNKIKKADIIVTVCGIPGLVNGLMIKKEATIIDGGITRVENNVKGDVDFESVKNISGHITPIPGGVGPVTVACLMENVYLAAKNR